MKTLVPLMVAFMVIGGGAAAQPAQEKLAPPDANERPSPTINLNVRVEITVREEGGTPPPTRKTTAITVVNGQRGSVRSEGPATPEDKFNRGRFSVDVRPLIESSDRIRTSVTLEYGSATSGARVTSLTFTPVLENGRRMVVSESADPVTDRRIIVEVSASILK
jgi:hypothetical protein